VGKIVLDIYNEGSACNFYSYCIGNQEICEFEKFMSNISSSPQRESDIFYKILSQIADVNGAKERYFRPEGKYKDRVWALPLIDGCKIRLYCIIISEKILIIGNGGVKKVGTYQQDFHLDKCVEILQKIDAKLKILESTHEILYLNKTILDLPLEIKL
jgi:hypothetical protein